MESQTKKALKEVMEAMVRLNGQFEDRVKILRLMQTDEKELADLTKGAMAMKDAAGIYLAWAGHYIERLDKSEGIDLSEECEGVEGGNV
ncbi:MAG: hypothetical protein AAB317_04260 [Nitrospirota bacterium]